MSCLPPRLEHCAPRPRNQARDRRYPRLVEAGIFAAATAACGGDVVGDQAEHDPDPMIAGGIAEPYGTGGEAAGGAGPVAGTPTVISGATGGEVIGTGGGDIDGGAAMPFTGGAGASGGTTAIGMGGTAGVASSWDGWMSVRLEQSTDCVSAGQPLAVEVHVGQAAASLAIFGTRTVVAPEGTEACLPNFVTQDCVVAEEFGVSLSGDDAQRVMDSFSYLPDTTCVNDGVECEMPCNAPSVEIDGIDRGSTFCCGTFDDPEFARRAQAAIDSLMALVDARLSDSAAE